MTSFRTATAAAALALAACGGSSGGGQRAAETIVDVDARDDACSVDRSTVPPGVITFSVTNRGTMVTETYLYAPHDQVVGEVENVDPGATASFTVDVAGGAYEVACKPGQDGDGIRTPFQITGPLDPNQTAVVDPATARGVSSFAVEVDVAAEAFAHGLDDLVVVTGQTITFRVHNGADATRKFAVVGPDGTVLGQSSELAPAASADVTVTFPTSGTYRAVDPTTERGTREGGVELRVID